MSAALNPYFDPSVLRICDSSPVKVTFLKSSGKDRHILGFYTIDGNVFKDIRILFVNAGNESLIPNVSSVFLGNRLNGKIPVFFTIENGFDLNAGAEWFQDVTAQNGFWRFLSPCSDASAFPVLERGNVVWKDKGETIVEAGADACLGTEHPVLVWQSNDGRLFVPKGSIYHSFGYGLYPEMNPDDKRHALLFREAEGTSLILNFTGNKGGRLESDPTVSVRLQIGDRNFDALTQNRVGCFIPLNLARETVVEEMSVILPENSPDTLYLEGFDDQKSLPVAQRTFEIRNTGRALTLKSQAPSAVYEALCSLVKIRTASPSVSETDVSIVLKTSRGDVTRRGSVSILSENMMAGTIFSTKTPLGFPESELPPRFKVSSEKPSDPLPVFLRDAAGEETTPASLVKTAASLLMKNAPNGKTALITGGAKRIGRAIATGLARRGWNVLIHCCSSVGNAGKLVEEIRQTYGVKTAYVRCDFTDAKELRSFLPSVVETHGSIDALINNAAVFEQDSFDSCSQESWDANMTMNLRVPFLLSQDFARLLPPEKTGNIVNILDQRVLNPTPYFTSYTLSKSGLALLTRTIALALAPRIKVNGVAPGDVFPAQKQSKADFERRCSQTPLKKGAPAEEIADAVAFVLETSCLTGQIIALDGGQNLNWSAEIKTGK